MIHWIFGPPKNKRGEYPEGFCFHALVDVIDDCKDIALFFKNHLWEDMGVWKAEGENLVRREGMMMILARTEPAIIIPLLSTSIAYLLAAKMQYCLLPRLQLLNNTPLLMSVRRS